MTDVVVVGFDPSFTSYGISNGERSERIRSESADGGPYVRAQLVFAQIRQFLTSIGVTRNGVDQRVFLIEGPSFGSAMQGALWDAGYLMARFDLLAVDLGAVVHVVQPSTLKKFVTGKGNTPKAEMPLRVFKKWGIEFPADPGQDKLHAYCLYRFGVALLAGEVELAAPKLRGKGKHRQQATRAAARTKAGL